MWGKGRYSPNNPLLATCKKDSTRTHWLEKEHSQETFPSLVKVALRRPKRGGEVKASRRFKTPKHPGEFHLLKGRSIIKRYVRGWRVKSFKRFSVSFLRIGEL